MTRKQPQEPQVDEEREELLARARSGLLAFASLVDRYERGEVSGGSVERLLSEWSARVDSEWGGRYRESTEATLWRCRLAAVSVLALYYEGQRQGAAPELTARPEADPGYVSRRLRELVDGWDREEPLLTDEAAFVLNGDESHAARGARPAAFTRIARQFGLSERAFRDRANASARAVTVPGLEAESVRAVMRAAGWSDEKIAAALEAASTVDE